ncbi:MAG: hypothetical protein H7A25_18525 [Leptospiraceae bacterium]|nr:hypothetical protein [Leptospiraceae bacterium]MCP5501903.1 hypothetical protein [Leptospiraceae bacterium]
MERRYVSLPFSYSQSYKVSETTGDPELYSEGFSVQKVNIAKHDIITIKNIRQFTETIWKKKAADVVPKLSFVFGNEVEKIFFNQYLRINPSGYELITPSSPEDLVYAPAIESELPIRFINYEVYIKSLEDFYSDCVFFKIASIKKFQFPVSQVNSEVGDIELKNDSASDFLYIIPYCASLLQTEFYGSGTIQFELYGGI